MSQLTPNRRAMIVGPTNYFWHPRTGAVSWYAWSGFYVCVFTFAISASVIARMPAAIIGIISLTLACRLWRMGVFEQRDALVVRNLDRTYRVPWDEVTAVDVDDRRLCIRTVTRDVYPFWGSIPQRPSADAERWLARQVDHLKEAVDAHRVAAG